MFISSRKKSEVQCFSSHVLNATGRNQMKSGAPLLNRTGFSFDACDETSKYAKSDEIVVAIT